jgi:hypothetical protein
MARHSSFGSRLGAFRNRQIRHELRFGWKSKGQTNVMPVVESDPVAGCAIASILILIMIIIGSYISFGHF